MGNEYTMLDPKQREVAEVGTQIIMLLRDKFPNRKDAIFTLEGVLATVLVALDEGDFEERLQELNRNLRAFYAGGDNLQ